MKIIVVAAALLATQFVTAARAQDALVVAASADRMRDGNGGGISALWISPRANDTFIAGASFFSLPGARWAYGTFGDTRKLTARTTINAEANLGAGDDDRGSFHYVLLRGGITRVLIPARLFGEAEWLQTDVARQQDGIVRVGGAWMPRETLTLRGSLYQSLFGDSDTTLGTVRADYALADVTVIGGATTGTATPALLQTINASSGRVREVFGGASFDAAARRWTVIASTGTTGGEHRHRLSVSCRLPLARRGRR